jgi:hypothetical protein
LFWQIFECSRDESWYTVISLDVVQESGYISMRSYQDSMKIFNSILTHDKEKSIKKSIDLKITEYPCKRYDLGHKSQLRHAEEDFLFHILLDYKNMQGESFSPICEQSNQQDVVSRVKTWKLSTNKLIWSSFASVTYGRHQWNILKRINQPFHLLLSHSTE